MGGLSKAVSRIDPTTPQGRAAIGTGGASILYDEVVDPALRDFDDAVSGQDQKEAAKDAAARQEDAAQRGLDLQESIYKESIERSNPFYEKGLGSLENYFNLIDPEGAANFRSNYLQGDEYQQITDRGLDQLAQRAAFGGGLGATGTNRTAAKYLQDSAFNLPEQALQRELSRLGQGVGIGQSALGLQTSTGQSYGNQASQGFRSLGDAQATGRLAGAPTGISPYLGLVNTGLNIYKSTQGGGS